MLVLRRKPDEALVMNGAVTICILAVEGERVKLGIIAPPDIVVVRGELIDVERQRTHLRRKQEALAREQDPHQREKLEQSLARLRHSMRLIQPAIAPASAELPGHLAAERLAAEERRIER